MLSSLWDLHYPDFSLWSDLLAVWFFFFWPFTRFFSGSFLSSRRHFLSFQKFTPTLPPFLALKILFENRFPLVIGVSPFLWALPPKPGHHTIRMTSFSYGAFFRSHPLKFDCNSKPLTQCLFHALVYLPQTRLLSLNTVLRRSLVSFRSHFDCPW